MQQDLECGAYAKTCGDDDMVDSDRPITGNDSSTISTFVVNKLESVGATKTEREVDEELRREDKQAIDQAWNDLHELRHHAAIDWQLYIHAMEQPTQEQMEIQALYLTLVMNPYSLSEEERARLWHWRLAHPHPSVPVNMTKGKKATNMRGSCTLTEDCPVCDKAKFRRLPFYKPKVKD